jgi:hypothetical protein
MSKGVELVLVIKQETIILPKVEPTIAQGIPMVVKVSFRKPVATLLWPSVGVKPNTWKK